MEKLPQKIWSFALTLITLLAFAQLAKSQVTVTVARAPHPAWEGKPAGDAQPFERNNSDLKIALLSQPVPDIWLEFAESQREDQPPRQPSDAAEVIIKVTLPPEAKEILKLHWEEALKFFYGDVFEKPGSVQEAVDRDRTWSSYNFDTIRRLQKVEIPAPDGRRALSDVEAQDLRAFANKAASHLVMNAKQN